MEAQYVISLAVGVLFFWLFGRMMHDVHRIAEALDPKPKRGKRKPTPEELMNCNFGDPLDG